MDGQEKDESVKNLEQTGRKQTGSKQTGSKQTGSNEKRRSSGGGK